MQVAVVDKVGIDDRVKPSLMLAQDKKEPVRNIQKIVYTVVHVVVHIVIGPIKY